jgi:putative heme transporter
VSGDAGNGAGGARTDRTRSEVPRDATHEHSPRVLHVRVSVTSILLVIATVVAALVVVNLFDAAQRPLGWVVATSIVAWLLSWIIGVLDRWMPRPLAVVLTVLAFVLLVGGGWVGVRTTIHAEVDRLRSALPEAARDLEEQYDAAADFNLADRTQAFVDSLDERFGAQAQVAEAAGTASTYLVTGVLMLFLVGYGPRFVSAALRQIPQPAQGTAVAVVYLASSSARAYLLITVAQAIVITGICSIVFYLLDLPAPFILGLVVGGLSAIPYFGVILGGLAPLLAAATAPRAFSYLVIVALLVGLQLVEILAVRPQREHRTLRVGPALMLIGILIGFELYGIGGAVYGTAALVFLWAVWQAIPDRTVETAAEPAASHPIPGP